MMATMTARGAVTVTVTATATATKTSMTKISMSYRAWQVPAHGSKDGAIRLFLFKCSDHVKSGGNKHDDSNSNSNSNSDSNSNTDDDDNAISVI